jgi:hypothetical protein
VICAVSFVFQFKILNQFPQYIHSWAQCDRYALALGFIDNGGDLFHPQTYVMNNQFPGEFMIPGTTTITSVDFPIHDYVVSFIMRIANSTEPWCFRLYILVYSIIGLYFLYKLTALFTLSVTRSLFVVLFALSSPVFLYYQAGFLPTIPSLANGFIGLYFFVSFLKNGQRKFFYLSILFITLAALARLPLAIVLVAMICFEAFYVLKNRRVELFKIAAFMLSVACILAYYKYNNHLRKEYGSLFLNYIIPASSVHDLLDFTKTAAKKWGVDYLNPLSYGVFGIAVLALAFVFFKRKLVLNSLEKQFLFLVCIALGGCCLYYLLMTYQFMNHDYYFLDTFYMPMIGLFLFCVVKWPELNFRFSKQLNAFSLLVFVPVFIISKHTLDKRVTQFDTDEKSTAENYKGASKLLDSLAIPTNAKLLVFGSEGSNNAFVLLKRKGFVIIEPETEKIKTSLKWPYDYVVLDDQEMMSKVYAQYPEIIHELIKVGGNGLISVYKKAAVPQKNIMETAFFELDKRPVLFHDQEDLEFSKTDLEDLKKYSVRTRSLDSTVEYGFTFKVKNNAALKKPGRLLKVTFHPEGRTGLKELLMCVSLDSKGKNLYFKVQDISAKIQEEGWQEHTYLYVLPQVREGESELGIFIWNKGKNNLLYDDFQITIY